MCVCVCTISVSIAHVGVSRIRGQYACDLAACAHLDTFMVAFWFKIQFKVVLLLVVNIDTLNTSR